MRSLRKSHLFVLASLCFIQVLGQMLGGCAGGDINESNPDEVMKLAEKDIENDRYQLAVDKLRLVKNKFPYSNLAKEAQLRLADVYFIQESFGEAAIAYEAFKDLYPKHDKVPYAMFRIAKSHYNDVPSNIARDLSAATKALDAYTEFLRRFPTVPESAEAQKDLADCRRILSEKELYIGNFYFKRDIYGSARSRFEKLIALYPGTEASKEAQEKLGRIPSLEPK